MRSGKPIQKQRGFGYMMVLFAIAALGLVLAGAGQVWQVTQQREREAELLFIGSQFRLALESYQRMSPETAPRQPRSLEELLEDKRFVTTQRHLRKLYRDPMSGKPEWGLVKVADRIVGVHSLSTAQPIKTFFNAADAEFASASSYAQWVFLPKAGGAKP
jgi:type II secretory pathway pseudopilin PulG